MSSIELVLREGLFSAWIYHKFHSGVKEWKYSLVVSEMVKLYQYLTFLMSLSFTHTHTHTIFLYQCHFREEETKT